MSSSNGLSKFVFLAALAAFAGFAGCGSSTTTDAGTGGGGGTIATGGGSSATGGGGGSATTGGGSGGGGGAVATGGGNAVITCRELSTWAASELVAAGYDDTYVLDGWHYDYAQFGSATVLGTAGNGDYLAYEYWSLTPDPALPITGAPSGPIATCEHCAYVYEDCTSTTCARAYLGISGTSTVTAFTADSGVGGAFEAMLSDVTFVEWDGTNDEAVDGGACLHLSAQTITGAW